jgi:hypothetical protein
MTGHLDDGHLDDGLLDDGLLDDGLLDDGLLDDRGLDDGPFDDRRLMASLAPMRSELRYLLGPHGRRRGAQGLDAARSASSSDFAQLSERSAPQGARSEFCATRPSPSTAEQSAQRTADPGSPFLW